MIHHVEHILKRVPFLYQVALRMQAGLVGSKRNRIARKYLHGRGIEIGALHTPLHVGSNVQVAYVDRLTREGLQAEYPEMKDFHQRFVKVDIVDDGEVLSSIADGSLAFVIANHMLEHCENPLGTMRIHLNKLTRGGVLYYAIPDKSRTFDRDRPLTTFEHLILDDTKGSHLSRQAHYQEFAQYAAPYAAWLSLAVKRSGGALEAANQLMDSGYSIHFHVWNMASLSGFVCQAKGYLGDRFELDTFAPNGSEIIVVLRRH